MNTIQENNNQAKHHFPQTESWANQRQVECAGVRYDEMPTPPALRKDYRFLRLLGEGANGKTYLAVSRLEQTVVAIKAMKLVDDFKSLDLFKREAQTLANVQVNGVPKFYGFVASQDSLDEYYIIQEYIDYPSLQDWIDQYAEEGKTFSEAMTLQIMSKLTDILYALQTAYSPPIIHRDIKPSNILWNDKTGDIKLIDFGAVANPAKKGGGSTVAGTQGFMAPEQLMGECTIQSDFYAMGATMLYMLLGISPVDIPTDPENPFLLQCDGPLKKRGISKPMRELIQELLSPQSDKRPLNATALKDRIHFAAAGHSKTQVRRKSLPKWLQNGRVRLLGLRLFIVICIVLFVLTLVTFGKDMIQFLSPVESYIRPNGMTGYRSAGILKFILISCFWGGGVCIGIFFSYYILPMFFTRVPTYAVSIIRPGSYSFSIMNKNQLNAIERKAKVGTDMQGCGDKIYKIRPVYYGSGGGVHLYEYVYTHNGQAYYYYGRALEGETITIDKNITRIVVDQTDSLASSN